MLMDEVEVVKLARKLPIRSDAINLDRIRRTKRFGHLILQKKGGVVVGFAEVFRVREVPEFPAVLLIDDPKGKYLYCYSAVTDNIRELINIGKSLFPECECIVYHRHKKANRLFREPIERNSHVKSV